MKPKISPAQGRGGTTQCITEGQWAKKEEEEEEEEEGEGEEEEEVAVAAAAAAASAFIIHSSISSMFIS